MTVFLRIIEAGVDEKGDVLLRAVTSISRSVDLDTSLSQILFEAAPEAFSVVPGSPFAYWVSESVRAVFRRLPRFEGEERTAKQGLVTADDFRFLRLWWGVPAAQLGERWFGFAKGGAFSPYYADVELLVGYSRGDQVGLQAIGRYGRGASLYFRPGLTWPLRTDGLSFRTLPADCIFSHKGPAAFVDRDDPSMILALNALMNSCVFGYLVSVQLARTELAQSYEIGVIQQTPVPTLSDADTHALAHLAQRAWSLKHALDMTNETSHAFVLPPGLSTILASEVVECELESIRKQIDDAVFILYNIGAEDRVAIEAWSKRTNGNRRLEDDDESGENDGDGVAAFGERVTSWLAGVAFGRFDLRLATGERAIPSEPDPLAALPARSPGMFPDGEEPADRPDILVDDEGHADDLVARVRAVAQHVHVDVPDSLRGWLAKEFFSLHIKMYSKSRRKAPIYWQLATPSASYSVWLYIHAFSKDTIFRVQNDYAVPKLAHEERRLESLSNELRDGPTAAQRKQLAAQEAVVEELRAFLAEVKRVAPLWNPNLDDGVMINFAPLWRLVPQNKSWQKELKTTWDALCEGKYDWAHLAMHLWPERVTPKCMMDRSFAIAHGLEDVFWVEGTDGKWTPRKTPTKSVDELVKERTSTAVKSALKNLLEAPSAGGTAAKPKKAPRKGSAHA